MSVIQNIVVEYHPVHRFPLTKVLVAGTDFKLKTDGIVKGYGTNPVDELVVGVSSFDPRPIPAEGHGVVHSDQFVEQCSYLTSVPRGVVQLVQDYQVPLRYREKKLHKKLKVTVNHYSIYPVHDMAVAEWQQIIYLTDERRPLESSCAWLPCDLKAEGELQDIEFSDGSENEDTDGLRDFGTHALYQLSKFLFPFANLHDKIHLNGMLTMIATHKEQSFDYFLSHDIPFMRAIYSILSNTKVALPSSLCNFAGIVLAKLEAAFGTLTGLEEDDGEEEVEKVTDLTCATTQLGVTGSPVIEHESSHAVKSVSTKGRSRTFSHDVIQKAEHIFHIIVKSAKLVCDKSAVVVKFNIKYSPIIAEERRREVQTMMESCGIPVISGDKKVGSILLTFHVGHLPSTFKHIYYDLVDRIQSKYEDAVGVGYTTDGANDTLDEERDEYKLNFDMWTALHSEPAPVIIKDSDHPMKVAVYCTAITMKKECCRNKTKDPSKRCWRHRF